MFKFFAYTIFTNMPEDIHDKKVFTLLQVMQSIKKTLATRYTSAFWIKAEMNKLNFYPHSGHCYPDLVEKENGKLIAQVRSVIWKDDYLSINRAFQSIVKEPLKDGIKILFRATITFDASYGLSLRIMDIDPGFSLGDLEQEKSKTIEKLKQDGIYGKNKLLTLPLLPKRIAIISVDTSKGYADFMSVIEGNQWGYRFSHTLFPALLQGEKAINSLIHQLHQIKKICHRFDVVAIIRGGGGDVGLSCYNDLRLSQEVALFPLPVITGIGHSTNETVVEMLAFENAITPTKLAEFLIQRFHNYAVPVQRAEEKIISLARRILKDEQLKFLNVTRYFRAISGNLVSYAVPVQRAEEKIVRLSRKILTDEHLKFYQFTRNFRSATGSLLANGNNAVQHLNLAISQQSKFLFKSRGNELANMERTVNNLSPENVLKRGYSITLLNGRAVKGYGEVKEGDKLTTLVIDGMIQSEVISTPQSAAL